MVGWHQQFNGHEFEKTLGGSEGHGMSLACCSPSGHKEVDTTEQLNNYIFFFFYVLLDCVFQKISPFLTCEHMLFMILLYCFVHVKFSDRPL